MKVALVCIAKWEDTIEEWTSYHKKIGFDKIFIYQNDWDCQVKDPNVVVIDFPGKHQQMPAYNHFLDNFRNEFDWVAFFDIDEYLVLKKHKDIKELITEFDNPYGIGINWVYFGGDNQEEITGDKKSFISRFLKRGDMDRHVKCILNLRANSNMPIPHHPNTPLLGMNRKFFIGPFNYEGDIETAQINHYYQKSLEEWSKLYERGQSDYTPSKKKEDWFSIPPHNHILDKLAYEFFYENKN
jgi:hypothetical protein